MNLAALIAKRDPGLRGVDGRSFAARVQGGRCLPRPGRPATPRRATPAAAVPDPAPRRGGGCRT